MTNKLKFFIGNWKMFGDFNSFKIIHKINEYVKKHKRSKNSKVVSALNQKLNIILCVGEKFIDRKKGKTFAVIRKQIKGSLEKKFNINKIILAYEPVWSIGTNKTPKAKDLKKIILFIKSISKKIYKTKKIPRVLYGGSVTPRNIRIFSSISEIDGFLIGGASQSSKKFIDIIKNYYK